MFRNSNEFEKMGFVKQQAHGIRAKSANIRINVSNVLILPYTAIEKLHPVAREAGRVDIFVDTNLKKMIVHFTEKGSYKLSDSKYPLGTMQIHAQQSMKLLDIKIDATRDLVSEIAVGGDYIVLYFSDKTQPTLTVSAAPRTERFPSQQR